MLFVKIVLLIIFAIVSFLVGFAACEQKLGEQNHALINTLLVILLVLGVAVCLI